MRGLAMALKMMKRVFLFEQVKIFPNDRGEVSYQGSMQHTYQQLIDIGSLRLI